MKKIVLKQWHIYAAVIAGTIVRLLYGLYTHAWLGAPDQLAWQLSLDEAVAHHSFSYEQLIHYPHEGGSFFVSLLAICLRPFQYIMPPLSLAALVIDSVSRLIQIRMLSRMCDSVTVFWFAVWSILSVPLLIPWGTVDFGLHSLSAFLPFVFLYFVTTYTSLYPSAIICGIVTAVSVSLSYDNIIFIPAFIAYTIIDRNQYRNKLYSIGQFLLVTFICLIPHIALRYFFDTRFQMNSHALLSVRGEDWGGLFLHFRNAIYVWHHSLPASFLLSSIHFLSAYLQRDIVFGFCILSFFLFLIKGRNTKTLICAAILISVYIIIYAFSPFYADSVQSKSYVYYRHLAYIIPLLTAFIIKGFYYTGKAALYLAVLWLLLCSTATVMYINSSKKQLAHYDAAGWILALKFGDDTKKLMDIYDISPSQNSEEIIKGYGWGFTSIILDGKNISDTMAVNKLVTILKTFPLEQQEILFSGVETAFSPNITPMLDPALLDIVERKMIFPPADN